MKILILLILLVFCFKGTNAQHLDPSDVKRIYLSDTKTTYLDFPENVRLIDIGNKDYTSVIKDDGDLVFLKAKSSSSQQTNLLVKYGSKLFMCELAYKKSPDTLLYNFQNKIDESILIQDSLDREIEIIETKKEEVVLSALEKEKLEAVRLLSIAPRNIQTVGVPKSGVVFSLARVSASSNFIYYKLIINNISNIDFEIDFFSVYSEEKPNSILGSKNKKISNIDISSIKGEQLIKSREVQELILSTKKYSINQRGVLVIQLYEKNGSRHITLNVPSKYILNF